MNVTVKESYKGISKDEVRNLVLAGIAQIKEGKTQDFNEVCDRLVKKYSK